MLEPRNTGANISETFLPEALVRKMGGELAVADNRTPPAGFSRSTT